MIFLLAFSFTVLNRTTFSTAKEISNRTVLCKLQGPTVPTSPFQIFIHLIDVGGVAGDTCVNVRWLRVVSGLVCYDGKYIKKLYAIII